MNEVLRAIAKRSSIRAYKDEPITEEELSAVITAGLQAPTARNMREVHISVVDGNNPLLKEIDTENKLSMLAAVTDEETREKIRNNPNNFYHGAPTVMILSADKNFHWSKTDAGIAVENMSIAAQSMGLGSLIIGIIDQAMHGDKAEYFAKALDFPDGYEFIIAFAVGYRDTEKEPHEIDFENSVSFI